jgi:hypothetical protein
MRQILTAFALAATLATPAAAAERTEVGMLDCTVEGGAGFVIGSSKDLACTFSPTGGAPEAYFGTVKKLGLDIGVTGKTFIKWAVFAPTADAYAPGALAGDYVGASAEATAGLGVGANALIGGSNETFMLQPISVQAQQGLNLAVGFSAIALRTTQD